MIAQVGLQLGKAETVSGGAGQPNPTTLFVVSDGRAPGKGLLQATHRLTIGQQAWTALNHKAQVSRVAQSLILLFRDLIDGMQAGTVPNQAEQSTKSRTSGRFRLKPAPGVEQAQHLILRVKIAAVEDSQGTALAQILVSPLLGKLPCLEDAQLHFARLQTHQVEKLFRLVVDPALAILQPVGHLLPGRLGGRGQAEKDPDHQRGTHGPMKIRTTGQLFEHPCQIKDMKLAGFSPSGLRYLCGMCGGQFVLRLDREKWEKAFGENPSFRLTKKILTVLQGEGVDAPPRAATHATGAYVIDRSCRDLHPCMTFAT